MDCDARRLEKAIHFYRLAAQAGGSRLGGDLGRGRGDRCHSVRFSASVSSGSSSVCPSTAF